MIHGPSRKSLPSVILTTFITVILGLSMFAVSTPTHAQQYVTCNQTYTVQPGDDLYRISLSFGVTIAALQAANNIANANLIYAGEVLCIPTGTAPIGIPQPFQYYGYLTPTPIGSTGSTLDTTIGDIGGEPPINAIGNFLEICGDCSAHDINATQRQFRQDTLVCASVKPVPNTSEFGWYRVNSYWCGWYPSF